MIYELANILYTPGNIEAGRKYLSGRKINPDNLKFPVVLTDTNSEPFNCFRRLYHPNTFTECAFFPIVDFENPTYLIGFDVRYIGKDPTRLRYHKFKINPQTFLLYFTQELDKIDPNKPMLVTEGFVDAETLRELGYPVISPLTAMHSLKFCAFLKAISNKIYICYDNDEAGKKAVLKIMQEVSIDPNFKRSFNFLNYSGKDPNQAANDYGKEYLHTVLKGQIV
ncbi:MAG: toprim domain-containing protein [Candidatus Pacearchaeota archaeon]